MKPRNFGIKEKQRGIPDRLRLSNFSTAVKKKQYKNFFLISYIIYYEFSNNIFTKFSGQEKKGE